MQQRMQVAIAGLLQQLERHRIESELILVDWNPPAGRPPLKDVIRWPRRMQFCTVRVVVVPPAVHGRYPHSSAIPLIAVRAVNCGIRRARGEFVLPGVIDLLYSDDLMAFISQKALCEGARYRVDRYDVERSVVQCETLDEQLEHCGENVIRVAAEQPAKPRLLRWTRRHLPVLHTDACGDFQLMSRRQWRRLRGYREADSVAAHVDGLLSYASYAAGVREVVLRDPMRVYHIDHDDKFTDQIQSTKLPLEERLVSACLPAALRRRATAAYRLTMVALGYKIKTTVRGVPTMSHADFGRMCRDIVAGRRSFVLNNEDWGLGGDSIEESALNVADWDVADGTRNQ